MIRTHADRDGAHTGKRPMIYTDITFHRTCSKANSTSIRTGSARPRPSPSSATPIARWTFWQFTTTGRVPGISGDVDRNAFYGSENQWRMFVASSCDPRDDNRLPSRLCAGKDGATQTRASACRNRFGSADVMR